MEYKYILILSYLNTMKSSYSYSEMSSLFGLTFKQIEIVLNKLEKNSAIVLDKYYKLTQAGIEVLKTYNLENIDFFDTINEEDDIFTCDKIGIDEVYIPIGFIEKVK